jgi:hypothetical protein
LVERRCPGDVDPALAGPRRISIVTTAPKCIVNPPISTQHHYTRAPAVRFRLVARSIRHSLSSTQQLSTSIRRNGRQLPGDGGVGQYVSSTHDTDPLANDIQVGVSERCTKLSTGGRARLSPLNTCDPPFPKQKDHAHIRRSTSRTAVKN